MRKRIFALFCCGCLLAGLLTGCKEKAYEESVYEKYTPAGTVSIHFGPALNLLYDDTGMILRISGENNTGRRLATCCTDLLFKPLSEGVPALMQYAIDNHLLEDARTMVIRVGEEDPLVTETMLTDLAKLCQASLDKQSIAIKAFPVEEESLVEGKYLPPALVSQLAAIYLDCEPADVTCSPLTEGMYTVTYGEQSCTVDGFTGGVTVK